MPDRATKVREIVRAHGIPTSFPYPLEIGQVITCLLDRVTPSGFGLYRCDVRSGGGVYTREWWLQPPGGKPKRWTYDDGRFHRNPGRPPAASRAKRWTQVAVARDFDP